MELKRGPGRPPKESVSNNPSDESAPPQVAARSSGKVFAKTVQLGIGVDLLGSALSLNHKKGNSLEVTPIGIKAIGGKSNRVVLIPWANIRAAELLPDSDS